MKERLKGNPKAKVLSGIAASIVACSLAFTALAPQTSGRALAAESDDIPFKPTLTTSINDSFEKSNAVVEDVLAEGATLLKNNGALPLNAAGAKITVLGKNSVDPALGGGGSATGSGGGLSDRTTVDFYTSLTNAGFEVNPTVKAFYEDDEASGSGVGDYTSFLSLGANGIGTGETAPEAYTDEVKASFKDYNDAAVILLTRFGGEGFDLPRTSFTEVTIETFRSSNMYSALMGMMGNNEEAAFALFCQISGVEPNTKGPVEGRTDMNEHYLELDDYEKALIDMASENFDKVILVLNTGNPLELKEIEEGDKVDSVLWVGYPGARGFNSVGKIIAGAITPSGHTVDTYAADFTKDPTFMNFSKNSPAGNQYLDQTGALADPARYMVEYEEGIYSGYRYWETRGYTDGEDWYEQNVVYPFGYGLSYTQFRREVDFPEISELEADGEITVSVKVTNVGEYEGKDVVQLYYSAPYYEGEIEKSHVELGGFAKTELLQPGESDTVTITMSVQSMASYDFMDANGNDFMGYELDGGDYTFYVGSDVHDAWTKGESMMASVPDEGYTYRNDEVTGGEIVNRFDDVSAHFDIVNDEATSTLLSRNDWEGTFPEYVTEDELKLTPAELEDFAIPVVDAEYDEGQPWYVETMPEYAKEEVPAEDAIQLIELTGLDYDDPLWEEFIAQLTLEQMQALLREGGYRSVAIENLGVPDAIHLDGTNGFVSAGGTIEGIGEQRTFYCAPIVISSTWNTELAEKVGQLWGEEGIWSEQTGIYAPGANTHRSPFGGRNFEYYSEDPLLSGEICGSVVKGLTDKGVIAFIKHFAVNDQETNRDKGGLVTWADEQTMREIYFKAFEGAVKKSGSLGIMSSFNRIGAVWSSDRYDLMTQVLRDEWGFEGMVVTDYAEHYDYMNQNSMVRAGSDLWLSPGGAWGENKLGNISIAEADLTPTHVAAMQNAAKNILYATANSNAMNKVSGSYRNEHRIQVGEDINRTDTNGGGETWTTVVKKYNYVIDLGEVAVGGQVNKELPTAIAGMTYEVSGLPKGLTVSDAGVLSGTIAADAVNGFYSGSVVLLKDGQPTGKAVAVQMTVTGGVMAYDGQTSGTAYRNINFMLDVSSVGADVAYKVTAGELPAGLILGQEGIIYGRTTVKDGTYKVTVTASAEGMKDVDTEVTITVQSYGKLGLAGGALANGTAGTAYTASVAATGSDAATYTATGLPEGLTMDENGNITGTPTKAGTYTVTVTAQSFAYDEVTATYTITVAEKSTTPDPGPDDDKPTPGPDDDKPNPDEGGDEGSGCGAGCNSAGPVSGLVGAGVALAAMGIVRAIRKRNK